MARSWPATGADQLSHNKSASPAHQRRAGALLTLRTGSYCNIVQAVHAAARTRSVNFLILPQVGRSTGGAPGGDFPAGAPDSSLNTRERAALVGTPGYPGLSCPAGHEPRVGR